MGYEEIHISRGLTGFEAERGLVAWGRTMVAGCGWAARDVPRAVDGERMGTYS